MIREDYIMRMIEQLVKVVSKILFNKEMGNYQEANDNIESALTNISGLDYNLLNELSAKDIISLLGITKDDRTVSIKCIVIAKLLKEKAEIKELINGGNPASIHDYQTALNLYLEGILSNKNKDISLSDYYLDVKKIIKTLKDEISQDIRFSLFRFYELSGEYDKAENELFMLKDLNYPDIESEGIKFYKNLEKLSDIDLIKGNLSKKDVTQGLAEFIRK